MTAFISNKRYIIVLIILLSVISLFSVEKTYDKEIKFADKLMRERDYYRAITFYKKAMFEDETYEDYCNFQIAEAYQKSSKFKLSIRFLARLLNNNCSEEYKRRGNISLGLNYYGLKVYPIALDYFNKSIENYNSDIAYLYKGLIKAEQGRWEESAKSFEMIPKITKDKELEEFSSKISTDILKGKEINKKSPFLAGTFSTFVPGSGQFYSEHYYDGVMVFTYVISMAYGSYLAYQYDRHENDNYYNTYAAVSITSIFHLGNILGAKKTAEYHNHKKEKEFFKPIKKKIFSFDF